MAQNLFTPHTGRINSYQLAASPGSSCPGRAEQRHSVCAAGKKLPGALGRAGAGGTRGPFSAAPLHLPQRLKAERALDIPSLPTFALSKCVLESKSSLLADTRSQALSWGCGEEEAKVTAPACLTLCSTFLQHLLLFISLQDVFNEPVVPSPLPSH